MNLLVWLLVGGVLGWLVSAPMKSDREHAIVLNVLVGIIGALIAGFVAVPGTDAPTMNANDFSIAGLFVAAIGAAVLLAVVNFHQDPTVHEG